ncbi:hypothetical protein BU14_1063s0006 [Porphyra umbilicalis]|uniref:Glucose-methanol-choline oxidoreductase N-terminal domain-containing protein n=1 Tax=Porphyra umbilicalis TaxID=2786 RepID=A0A1X6NMP8_PORUM|nr:hypothetical protein BU14_1063s0006 [Porphyra umbilicalis]|eukprot:OSX69855.1 hypothetical protein BU14_1063s0006 [Porphyra umbilicalis]
MRLRLALAGAASAVCGVVAAVAAAASPPPPTDAPDGGAYPTAADYVIVGGGTAGCVLAARLCARLPAASVVLIERGRRRTAAQEDTGRAMSAVGDAWTDPALTEAWESEANPGLGGRPVTLLTGATLGGSSSINSGQWSVPRSPYASTWGVAGLDDATADRLYAVAEGVIAPAVPPPAVKPLYADTYLAAAASAGLPVRDAPTNNTDGADGMWLNRLAADAGGRRRDACSAYLTPVLSPGGACASNLRLLQGTTVTRVTLSPRSDGGRHNSSHSCGGGCDPFTATGVEVVPSAPAGAPAPTAGCRPHTITARVQVLLSAGPFGTPKLLQRSGIGPPAALAAAAIPVRVDLPVGAAALSRPVGVLLTGYRGVPLEPSANATARADAAAVAAWRAGAGGVVGTAITSALGRFERSRSLAGVSWAPPGATGGVPAFVSACLSVPTALATMVVADASPTAPLRVAPNLLGGDPAEVAGIVACLSRLRSAAAALPPTFGAFDVLPPPATPVSADTVRGTASSGHHTVAGAPVGPVLTPALGVRGVARLRVVDASAIPSIPASSALMASVYMLAEFAAERLVECKGLWSK